MKQHPNTITGVIAPYAGGNAQVGQAQTPIDQQGNFTVPVAPQPTTQTIILTPPLGTPYSPLSLSVALVPGTTNITVQIAGALTVVGEFIGLPGAAVLGTSMRGYAQSNSGSSQPLSGLVVNSTSGDPIILNDEAGGGIELLTGGALEATAQTIGLSADGDIFLNSGANGYYISGSLLVPALLYSVAGTPLPAARSGLAGARAVVSDATAPLWMAAYTGSGTVTCPVFCDGTNWYTA